MHILSWWSEFVSLSNESFRLLLMTAGVCDVKLE